MKQLGIHGHLAIDFQEYGKQKALMAVTEGSKNQDQTKKTPHKSAF